MPASVCIPCVFRSKHTIRTLSCFVEVYISEPGAVNLLSCWDDYIYKVRIKNYTHGWVLIIRWSEHGIPWKELSPHIPEIISRNIIDNKFAYSIISQHWVRSLSCFVVVQISGAAAVTLADLCVATYATYPKNYAHGHVWSWFAVVCYMLVYLHPSESFHCTGAIKRFPQY